MLIATNPLDGRTVHSYEALTMDIMLGYLFYDTIYELWGKSLSHLGVHDMIILTHHVLGAISHISVRMTNCGPGSFYT